MLLHQQVPPLTPALQSSFPSGAWPGGVPRGESAGVAVFLLALVGAQGWAEAAGDARFGMVAVQALLALSLGAGALLVVVARETGLPGLGWSVRAPQGWSLSYALLPGVAILSAQVAVAAALSPPVGQVPGRAEASIFVWNLLISSTLVPLGEEAVFRGLLLGGQLQRWAPPGRTGGTAVAVVLNGLAFALAHGVNGLAPFAQHLVFGASCAALAVHDRSIVRAVCAHAFVNAAILLATLVP